MFVLIKTVLTMSRFLFMLTMFVLTVNIVSAECIWT